MTGFNKLSVEELNTYFYLPTGWKEQGMKDIDKFYEDLKGLERGITELLLLDSDEIIDILNIEVDVYVFYKPKLKEEDLSINFWLDYATGNIDIDQL